MTPLKIVIVRTIKGQKYANFIAKEINLAGYRAGITDIKNLKKYLKSENCSPGTTLIHSRTAHPNLTYRVLKELEDQGYKIVNSAEAIRLTSDKYSSCIFAKENNIPCADTSKTSKEEALSFVKEKIREWEKVVVKPVTSQGQGQYAFMFNKDNISEIEGKIKSVPAKELVVQKYLDYERLSRVIVIGSKALEKAVLYDEPGNGWKCSVCLNPEIKVFKNPPQELLEFAQKIAKEFKAEICFVDIFTTKNGYVLNEINTACSLIIHERISQYNISKDIADYLLSLAK